MTGTPETIADIVLQMRITASAYRDEQQLLLASTLAHFADRIEAAAKVTGETSDGYHTFNELYHHRAVLFSVVVHCFKEKAWKSKLHADGTMFDGYFIVGVTTPQGEATYHYAVDPYWDMFDCRELERAPAWDGHTPADAIERIGLLRHDNNSKTAKVESNGKPKENGEKRDAAEPTTQQAHGNAAALRKALEAFVREFDKPHILECDCSSCRQVAVLVGDAKLALAAPSRNCDTIEWSHFSVEDLHRLAVQDATCIRNEGRTVCVHPVAFRPGGRRRGQMTTIWKYTLALLDEQTVEMPLGARILSVGVQRNRPVLWALVDPSQPTSPVEIAMVGTGRPATDLHYPLFLGTIELLWGDLVLHVFLNNGGARAEQIRRTIASLPAPDFHALELLAHAEGGKE